MIIFDPTKQANDMKNSKKVTAPASTEISSLLEGIRDGVFYANAQDAFRANGYEPISAGFSVLKALGINIEYRYTMQTVAVPSNIRGNMNKFAGKLITVICTAIHPTSPQMCMWAKPM